MEKVGIEIQLTNADSALNTLREIDRTVKDLGRKKTMIKLDDGSLVSVDERIKQIKDRLAALSAAKKAGVITKEETAEAKRLSAELKVISRGLKDGTAQAKSFAQVFNSISSKVAHVGSAMQSLGNAFTRLTSPFNRLTTGLLYGAGYKVLNLFTEGISGTFERADTMKLYPKMLKEFGFSAKESQKAISELEESVLGLPTGLDEIVAVQKRFVAASQDMEKSTGLAIAYNNAILASGSDARQQWTAQRILTQLAGGAELAATSWDALQRAIPLVFTELSKDAKMGVSDYVSALKTGQISTEDFMKAFAKIGGEGGTIANAARTMTKSWRGLTANIQNATKRMGTAVLDSLHEAFKEETGRDLLDTLLGIDAEGNRTYDGVRDWIDGISKSIQNWIKANPDKIIDFFNELKSIDVKGLLQGMAEGMKLYVSALKLLVKLTGGKGLQGLGKWMVRMSMVGRALTIFGGVIKGLRHPLGWLGAGAMKLGGRLGKIGVFGKIASFFGKKKAVEEAGEVGKAVTKVSPNLIKAFKSMALISGIVAMPALTAWGVTKGVKESIKNFKGIVDALNELKGVDIKGALITIGGIIGGFAGLGALMGGAKGFAVGAKIIEGELIAGFIVSLATGFAALNMSFIKSGIKNFADSIKILDSIPDIKDASRIKEKVGNAIAVFNELSDMFNGKGTELSPQGEVRQASGVKGISIFKRWGVSNLASALKSLSAMMGDIEKLSNVEIPEKAYLNIGRLVFGMKRIADNLGAFSSGLGFGEALSSSLIKATMKNVADELIQLRRMAYHINTLADVTISPQTPGKISALIATVTGVAHNLGKKFGGVNGIGNLVSSSMIKGTMKNLASQFIQLRRMAYHINKLGSTSINVEGFKATIGQIKSALDELKSYESDFELDIEVKLSKTFDTSVNKVVKQIKDAQKKITDAKNNLKSKASGGISISIPVSVTFSVATNFGAALGKILAQKASLARQRFIGNSNTDGSGRDIHGQATGGYVYRAKGGGIGFPGRPRGTDTVPTWLTPGEFVHNKQAVNTFGVDFMRKVNNLDVRGAMHELMAMAGGMANVNRGTVITNNYNNQKVTINNNNPTGAGFTFKSASRFVGAF